MTKQSLENQKQAPCTILHRRCPTLGLLWGKAELQMSAPTPDRQKNIEKQLDLPVVFPFHRQPWRKTFVVTSCSRGVLISKFDNPACWCQFAIVWMTNWFHDVPIYHGDFPLQTILLWEGTSSVHKKGTWKHPPAQVTSSYIWYRGRQQAIRVGRAYSSRHLTVFECWTHITTGALDQKLE